MTRIIAINNIKLILISLTLFFAFEVKSQVCTTEDTGNNWENSWTSCSTSSNPNPARANSHWLLYEFDEPQNILGSHIWNANRNGESNLGIQEAIIDYSTDGASWTNLGTFSFPKGNERADYEGFDGPDFGGIFVKKILITVNQSFSNNSCVSLAEVQFNINPDACYGVVDECGVCNGEGGNIWYRDQDGDGLGSPESTTTSCDQPVGFVANADDDCDTGIIGWNTIGAIFEENGCTGCHGQGAAGGLNLTSYSTTIMGGNKCGTNILTGTTLVDIITTDDYDGCGQSFIGPSMNKRVGGQIDDNELALIRKWVEDGTPEDCNCPEGSPDVDNDGFCDAIDNCPDIDNSLIGTPCDDGIDCTTNDVWREDCNCSGDLSDEDGDGICDTEDVEPENPCTADGVVDGVEPPGWIPNPDNDCDLDGIAVASGDLDDFSACIDREGTLNSAVCKCGDTVLDEGGILVDYMGLTQESAQAAGGLPDGIFTTNINNDDTLVIQFPSMEVGEDICLTVGFRNTDGRMRLFLNNRLMTILNNQALGDYQAQEICFKTFDSGVQNLYITDEGPGNIRIDGSTYLACPCDGENTENDIKNVACLANFAGIGWRQIPDCTIEVCEGEPLTLGTDRYETAVFQWTGPNGFTSTSSTISFDAVKPSDSGFYWISYQNPSGCNLNKRMLLNVNALPPVNTTVRQPSCGRNNGEITLSFTDDPNHEILEISIEGENGNYLKIQDNLGEFVYSGLAVGTYNIWARWDGGACPVNLGEFALVDQPAPVVNLGPNLTICEGESINFDATVPGSGISYKWNDGNSTRARRTIRPTLETYADKTFSYRVTVTDDNKCTDVDHVNVKVNARPQVTVNVEHPQGSASEGAITFNFPNHPTRTNLEFSIEGENGPYKKVADSKKTLKINNLTPGNYDAWVRWEDGSCPINLGIIKLIANERCPEINVTASKTSICEGETVVLKVNSKVGWKYQWSNGVTTASQTVNPTLDIYANSSVTYSVTVTDQNGCSTSDNAVIDVISNPRVTYNSTDPTCTSSSDGSIFLSFADHPNRSGIEFSVTGRNGKYRVTKDQSQSYTFNNLTIGKYEIWAKWGDGSCPAFIGTTELKSYDPTATLSKVNPTCPNATNGSIKLNFQDSPVHNMIGFSITGKNGAYKMVTDNSKSFTFRKLGVGEFQVWAKWKDGSCPTKIGTIKLESQNPFPTATIVSQNPTCSIPVRGSITLRFKDYPNATNIEFSVSGRNGRYMSVTDKSGSFTFRNLTPGKYEIWARWGNDSCPNKIGETELLEPFPKSTFTKVDPTCIDGDNGSIQLNFDGNSHRSNIGFSLTGKAGKYIYVKTNLKSYTFKNLKPGKYEIWAKWGDNTCPIKIGGTELLDAFPNATFTKVDPTCPNGGDGSIQLNFDDHPSRGNIEFSIDGQEGKYKGMRDDIGTYTFQNLKPGKYEIWARWGNRTCAKKIGESELLEPFPIATYSKTDPTTCTGVVDGTIKLSFERHPKRGTIKFSITGRDGIYKQVKSDLKSYTFKNLEAGNYKIWARWGNHSCPIQIGETQLLNPFPTSTYSKVDPTCSNGEDGSIELNFEDHPNRSMIKFSITGKGGRYTQVSGSSGSYTFKNLTHGTYDVWARWGNDSCPNQIGETQLNDDCNPQGIKVAEKEPLVSLVNKESIRSNGYVPNINVEAEKASDKPKEVLNKKQNISGLKVFPNPLSRFNGRLTIRYYAEQSGISLKFMSLTGQLIKELNPDQIVKGWNEIEVDLGYLPSGTYYVMDGYGAVEKFILIE